MYLEIRMPNPSSTSKWLCLFPQYDYFNLAITQHVVISILPSSRFTSRKERVIFLKFDVVSQPSAAGYWVYDVKSLSWFSNLMNSVCQVANISSRNSCHTAHTRGKKIRLVNFLCKNTSVISWTWWLNNYTWYDHYESCRCDTLLSIDQLVQVSSHCSRTCQSVGSIKQ